jgi:hypothetical protein
MTHYPIYISDAGNINTQGKDANTLIKALTFQASRQFLAGANIADLVNSTGATANGSNILTAANVALTDTAVSGSNLATKASFESALGNVQDALNELATKTNAYLAALALPTITYSGGGATPDGTVNAITVAVTAGTTGPDVSAVNPIVAAFNQAVYEIAVGVNTVAHALGYTPAQALQLYSAVYSSSVAALSTSTGTAGAPGLAATDANAVLTQLATNVATILVYLNTLNNGLGTPLVVARR